MRVRYEDLVQRPREVLTEILALLAIPAALVPVQRDQSLVLHGNHTAMGNASRFRTGEIELRPDVEWREGQSPGARRLITALTLPLLRAYGYPLSPTSRSEG